MIRRPPRSTLDRSSAASDVYKRQVFAARDPDLDRAVAIKVLHAGTGDRARQQRLLQAVSYTHLRAHETVLDLVCRLLLEQKNMI